MRSLGYRTDLALLRFGGTTVEDRGDHLVVRTPQNASHWWGNFLLLNDVPADAEPWLARFHATFPDAEHVTFGFDGVAGTVADLTAFASLEGFTAEAQAVMTASAVHPPRTVNKAAVCRPLVSDEDWMQSIELRMRSDNPGGDFRNYATLKMRTNRALVEAGHGRWFGAFLDDRLVCQMGLFATDDGLARFQHVETDPSHRRQGLAGTLVHHVSRYGFGELGARTLVMVADPDYVAIDLYRAVGFTVTESQLQVERKPR